MGNDNLRVEYLEEEEIIVLLFQHLTFVFSFSRLFSSEQQVDINRDVINSCSSITPNKKPVPDFNRLKAEQATNEEKVVEFLKASFKLPTTVEIVEHDGATDSQNESRREKITLPPTDRLSQMAIR